MQTSPCELNPQTGFPYEGECQFIPNEDQYGVTVSMMAFHFLENVSLKQSIRKTCKNSSNIVLLLYSSNLKYVFKLVSICFKLWIECNVCLTKNDLIT